MSTYRAPLAEMHFVLNELAGLAEVGKLPGFEEAAPDVVSAILDEAAKVATVLMVSVFRALIASRVCRDPTRPSVRSIAKLLP